MRKSLGKSDFVAEIAAKHSNLSRKVVSEVIDTLLSTIGEQLGAGNGIAITGFGKLSVASRIGRNPQTGQTMEVAASKSPKFTPGRGLKDVVTVK